MNRGRPACLHVMLDIYKPSILTQQGPVDEDAGQ